MQNNELQLQKGNEYRKDDINIEVRNIWGWVIYQDITRLLLQNDNRDYNENLDTRAQGVWDQVVCSDMIMQIANKRDNDC